MTAPAIAGAERTIEARRISSHTIQADGRLEEPAWASAPVGSGFVERAPVSGATPPVDTEFRVLFDDQNVYVAVSMHLLPGETPRALEMTRDDTSIWDDDAVTLKFDVQHDQRSTVGLVVNPAGAQLDFLALEGGRSFRLEYDAVWECGTSTTGDRWIAEFRVPFAALGLSTSAEARQLGFNVTRDHNARRATDDWSPIPPEFGAFSALHYGALRGVEGGAAGRPLTLIPYVLFSSPATPSSFGPGLQAGGDLRFRLAPDLWSELTVLTDFAQADIDDQIVNLDRFPLQLPEKRGFFLSGLDVFDFGHPQDAAAQLFFSRRIGLDASGDQVPILGGMKHYGRIGPVTLGVLDVVTLSSHETPAANWAVARVNTEVSRDLELGAIGTMRRDVPELGSADDPDVSLPTNFAGGVDGSLVMAQGRLQLQGFVAGSTQAEPDRESGTATRGAITWKGERLAPSVSMLLVSDDFDPAVGFVRQPGLARLSVDMPYTLRAPTAGIDQLGFETRAHLDGSDELDRVLGRGLFPDVWLVLRSGWTMSLGAEFTEDLVEEAFDLVPDVRISAGRYHGANVFGSIDSPQTRNPSAGLLYVIGNGLYEGRFHKLRAGLALALSRHLRLSANGEVWFVALPGEQPFSTQTVNARATVAVSTDLFADLILGGSSVESSGVGFLRLRWRWRPGSDLFVVYREDVSFGDRWRSERSVVLKLSALFDVRFAP